MSDQFSELSTTIRSIEERNARVEADKAWEISFFRTALVAMLTYAVAVLVLFSIAGQRPFINAVIPTLGYILSVQSIPFVKRRWIARYRKEHR